MLRITVINNSQRPTFKMEGKLTQEWVAEAEKAWAAFTNAPQPQSILVDLCGVSFVDEPGRELLALMHSSGAKLIGTGPMTGALIDEVCGVQHTRRNWVRSLLSLLFLLPLAAVTVAGLRLSPQSSSSAARGCIVGEHQPLRFIPIPYRRNGIDLQKGLPR
jgi:hypothetical protein